jgi:hypothetical protein
MRNNNTNHEGNETMSNLSTIKREAKILRYCGYAARADFQLMQIVIKTPLHANEWEALQKMHKSCIIVPNIITA